MAAPTNWINCAEALKLVRQLYGQSTDFCEDHPAHIALFRRARDGDLSLKAEAVTAHFDGLKYGRGKRKKKSMAPLSEVDANQILHLTISAVYGRLSGYNNPELIGMYFTGFDLRSAIFDVFWNNDIDFYYKWTVNGVIFDQMQIEYFFSDDPINRKNILSKRPRVELDGVTPYTNEERKNWIKNSTQSNCDQAFKIYKKDPRWDGSNQAAWRKEWKAIHGRGRGRPVSKS